MNEEKLKLFINGEIDGTELTDEEVHYLEEQVKQVVAEMAKNGYAPGSKTIQ
jgi:hypothetical protein